MRDLLTRPVFEKIDGSWIDVSHTITKQYEKRVQFSTNLTPIQASLKKIEGYVHHHLLDKRKEVKPKFQVNNLVRTADLSRIFSKGDTTNLSIKLYKTTDIIYHGLPSYHIDNLPERYNEALLEKTNFTMNKKQQL